MEHGTTPTPPSGPERDTQTLRRLGLEYLDAYRALYRAERRAIPDTAPTAQARKQAVSRALRALQRQHHCRYDEPYQQELKQTQSQPHPRRPGRPAGAPDRLTIAPEAASTWQGDGVGRRQSGQQGQRARQRAKQQAVRERAADLFAQSDAAVLGRSPTRVSPGRPRSAGAPAGGKAAPRRCQAVGSADVRPVPDSQLPAIEKALLKGAGAHDFDGDVWTAARVGVVIQQVTGVQLRAHAVQRLLQHERLGWSVQPMTDRQRGSQSGDGTAATGAPAGQGTGQGR